MKEITRQSQSIGLLVVVALLWSWSSLIFLPVVLVRYSISLWAISISITVLLGLAISFVAWRLAWRPPGFGSNWPWVAYIALVLSSLLVLPAYWYLVRNGMLGGLGGTRGEAIDLAVMRLADGQYPYSVTTSDGSPITPLPGGLLLAAPAVLLFGSAGYAIAYLAPLAGLLLMRVDRLAGGIAAIALLLAPAFWTDTLSSGDLVVTSFLAFVLGVCVLQAALRQPSLSTWLWPVALGVVGATRVTTMAVAVLVAALAVNAGRTSIALRQMAITVSTIAVLCVPFYLWNPTEFSPLHVSRFTQNSAGALLDLVFVISLLVFLARSNWVNRIPIAARTAFAVSLFAVGVTAIPVFTSLRVRVETGEHLMGYGVLALVAPVIVLGIRDYRSRGRLVPGEVESLTSRS